VKPSGLPELDEEEDDAALAQTPHETDGALQTQAPTGVMPAPLRSVKRWPSTPN
jgi:hypothetical protein